MLPTCVGLVFYRDGKDDFKVHEDVRFATSAFVYTPHPDEEDQEPVCRYVCQECRDAMNAEFPDGLMPRPMLRDKKGSN
jgi:hypothetical protein